MWEKIKSEISAVYSILEIEKDGKFSVVLKWCNFPTPSKTQVIKVCVIVRRSALNKKFCLLIISLQYFSHVQCAGMVPKM